MTVLALSLVINIMRSQAEYQCNLRPPAHLWAVQRLVEATLPPGLPVQQRTGALEICRADEPDRSLLPSGERVSESEGSTSVIPTCFLTEMRGLGNIQTAHPVPLFMV